MLTLDSKRTSSSSVAAGTFTFRSVILSEHLTGEAKVLPMITATIQYPIVVAAFFLSCWADPKPRHIDMEGKIRQCCQLLGIFYVKLILDANLQNLLFSVKSREILTKLYQFFSSQN